MEQHPGERALSQALATLQQLAQQHQPEGSKDVRWLYRAIARQEQALKQLQKYHQGKQLPD